MSYHVDVATRSHDYGETESSEAKATPDVPEPLYIERPTVESIPQMPKGYAKRSMINPNARVAQNYSIVEDHAQIPCAVSALEVLQSCPSQRSALLTVIRTVDLRNSLICTFDM